MKNIMFVISSMERGGAERVISVLSNRLVQTGYRVSICMLVNNRCGYEINPDVSLIDISNTKRTNLGRKICAIRRLRKTIDSVKPDIVFSFTMGINVLASFACKYKPVVFIPSERCEPRTVSFVWDVLVKRAFRQADHIVMQTERAKQYFSSGIQNKSSIIVNPVTVSAEASDVPEKRIVSAGRLVPQKNQKLLIEAFSLVHEKFPEYHLDIYGEGPLEEKLQNQIDSLNLHDFIHLKGSVADVQKRESNATLFVLSSDYEGLSNALIEASMIGLPCVSTDCAGSSEIIDEGVTGFVVPLKDTEALADRMNWMLSNPERAKKMGQEGRIRSLKLYNVETVIQDWIDLIERN